MVEIYCDGACRGNPGKSGSGIAIYTDKGKPILMYGGYAEYGTNNTAELLALQTAFIIAKRELIKGHEVTIFSDSKYSIQSVTVWAVGWKNNGWKKRDKKPIKNLSLIKEMHLLYKEITNVFDLNILHVKGHAGIEGNELADRMAGMAIDTKSFDYIKHTFDNKDDVLSL